MEFLISTIILITNVLLLLNFRQNDEAAENIEKEKIKKRKTRFLSQNHL